jgi:DNA-binding MarR family transcriptional regulator
VETTTGPLGQGLANAVGMAMAARRERGLFDPDAAPGASPFDHHVYVFCSDGDMEEGISHEVSSLAGHLGLDRTTFTRNLGVLLRDGLAAVQRGEDARQRLITLTAEGRRRLKAAIPRWEKAQQAAIAALGKENFSKLSEALSLPAELSQLDRKENQNS